MEQKIDMLMQVCSNSLKESMLRCSRLEEEGQAERALAECRNTVKHQLLFLQELQEGFATTTAATTAASTHN